MIGHTTFCIVVVYNNVLARLRRTQGSLIEAAMDLGANGFQTFRDVTLPLISTAIVAGAMLAFALSFDEVIVTTFTAGAQNTLPIWIFGPDPPGPAPARGERRGLVRDPGHDHPGRDRGAPHRRRWRSARAGGTLAAGVLIFALRFCIAPL